MSISLVCVITSLGFGGAESMLYKLMCRIDRRRFAPRVISLIELGATGHKIQALGIPTISLKMRPGSPNPAAVWRLAHELRRQRPDVISTWLYHADLIGGLAAKMVGNIPVVWGIRHCDHSREGNPWLTLQTVKVCARLSRRVPARIICNSEAAWNAHAAVGYATDRMVVIRNGLDLNVFKPDSDARRSVREELGLPPQAVLIGLSGRFHPHKDHHNFFKAATMLSRSRPNVHYLLCGYGVTWNNGPLTQLIAEAGLADRCHLLGARDDTPRLMAALDILVSSSFGESFPNVVGEAMSCGVPCVATDVGDSAFLVGATGTIVPPKNPAALSLAMRELVDRGADGRSRLGFEARRRITEHFDLSAVVERYQDLFEELAGQSVRTTAME